MKQNDSVIDVLLSLRWMRELLPTDQLESFIRNTCQSDGVQSVTINSTLGKHLPNMTLTDLQHRELPRAECHLIENVGQGNALILCNKTGRPDWEFQYKDVLYILQKQICLEVSWSEITDRYQATIIQHFAHNFAYFIAIVQNMSHC